MHRRETKSTLILQVDSINSYERNPRHAPNSAYEEIKQSLRQRGFRGSLTVTCRPGEEKYTVAEGGNTTLQIIKELYAETRDERFKTIECLVQPWVSETYTLLAHLIENDTRGDLTFIDRARAILSLRQLMEEEEATTYSQRTFVEALKERGYIISKTLLGLMEYAMRIYAALPISYAAGLGVKHTERIRKIESVMVKFLESREKKDCIEGARKWYLTDCLPSLDSEDLPHFLDPIQYNVEAYLKLIGDESLFKVRADFQLIDETGEPGRDADPIDPKQSEQETLGPKLSLVPSLQSLLTTDTVQPPTQEEEHPEHVKGVQPQLVQPQSQAMNTPTRATTTDIPEASGAMPLDVQGLRSRLWRQASQLAGRYGFADCIRPCSVGCGFLVDLPESSLFDGHSPTTALEATRTTLWWQLAGIADEWPYSSEDIPASASLQEARIYPALMAVAAQDFEKQAQMMDPLVGFPPSLDIATRQLIARLEESDYDRLTDMFVARRALETQVRKSNKTSVWRL